MFSSFLRNRILLVQNRKEIICFDFVLQWKITETKTQAFLILNFLILKPFFLIKKKNIFCLEIGSHAYIDDIWKKNWIDSIKIKTEETKIRFFHLFWTFSLRARDAERKRERESAASICIRKWQKKKLFSNSFVPIFCHFFSLFFFCYKRKLW